MRPIKFRAWDKNINYMISPEDMHSYDEFISSLGKVIEIEAWSGYSGGGFRENDITDERIIMQFVGLTDRNGKDVYEGDILSNGQHIDWIVTFEEASFKVKFPNPINTQRYVLDRDMAESREIIGNIYANPELVA